MNTNFWIMMLEIIVFLPFILFLVYASLKFGSGKLNMLQAGRYIKIYERTTISKENSLVVVQMGDKGYVIAVSNGKIEILKELEQEEFKAFIEAHSVKQYKSLTELIKKFNFRGKDNDEK